MALFYDRLQELKAFDESKAGVKGLVDSAIVKIPQMFVRPADELARDYPVSDTLLSIPVIDLGQTENDRAMVVESVRRAAETLGFFQVVNHGVPIRVLEDMLRGVRGFHELGKEIKSKFIVENLGRRSSMEVILICTNLGLLIGVILCFQSWLRSLLTHLTCLRFVDRIDLKLLFEEGEIIPGESPEFLRDMEEMWLDNLPWWWPEIEKRTGVREINGER